MITNRFACLVVLISSCFVSRFATAQDTPKAAPVRGSLIEDRAARKLLEAGVNRYDTDEVKKAVEIWESVIERYPRSRVRFQAHIRLGDYFLKRDRAYDKARVHFEIVASEENRDQAERAVATLKVGICFYEARNFGKCFQVMRDVIEHFPVSSQVNEAYYYIGLGHFQLGHYSRAISALEKVGTAMSSEDSQVEKVEAGRRLFVRIEDADLAALDGDDQVEVKCVAASGDTEIVKCFSVGRNVRLVLGSLPTRLGKPVPGNGVLEVKGDDKVKVTYTDEQTADKKFNQPVLQEVTVVGDGIVTVTDGAFAETLRGVVLGKSVNIQIVDADRDETDQSDSLKAVIEVHRAKTDEELEAEAIAAATNGTEPVKELNEEEEEANRYKLIDRLEISLAEAVVERKVGTLSTDDATGTEIPEPKPASKDEKPPTKAATEPTAAGDSAKASGEKPVEDKRKTTTTAAVKPQQPADDGSVHSGIFRTTVPLVKTEKIVEGDDTLQALAGDFVRIVYIDERNTTDSSRNVKFDARCIEGNLGGVRVTRAQISDRELRTRTMLKTAHALTNIGNRYKEFGLKTNADAKYSQALEVCEEIMTEARRLGGKLLEETYVQLWNIYFQMDRLELAAAMAQRLQRDFPNSGFVDDALLQLADVARKQGNTRRAIGIYTRLVNMKDSQLRGEAQFGVAQCYDEMAEATENENSAAQLYDRAFQEYKKVFENFPDSGRVGEAVAKMANYYYRQKDYARAIDTFETVLGNAPDAKYLDVILFNYGRCLYRMNRKAQARQRFDQLIADYPESPLATDAKKISEALAKAPPPTN